MCIDKPSVTQHLESPPTQKKTRSPYTTKSHLSLKVPGKGPPPCSPMGPLWREMLRFQSQWFIHSFISVRVPQLSSPMKWAENIWSPSMELHKDGRSTHKRVWPGSPRQPFMTLLSLPQCHASFSTIPSTLAWVDQHPVSQCVIITLYRVSPPHLLPPPTWPRVWIHIILRYGRRVGFMGGIRGLFKKYPNWPQYMK